MGRYLDVARQAVTWLPEETGLVAHSRAVSLRKQARGASTWEELYGVLEEAQAAYGAGEVTREEVETLTGYAGDRSRHLPQKWSCGWPTLPWCPRRPQRSSTKSPSCGDW